MGIAIVGLIVVGIVVLIAVPVMIRVLGEATRRNENRPEGEGRDDPAPGERGPGKEE